jgi:hypothetical protein
MYSIKHVYTHAQMHAHTHTHTHNIKNDGIREALHIFTTGIKIHLDRKM